MTSPPDAVVENRRLGFLIWQSMASAAVRLLSFLLLLLLRRRPPSPLQFLLSSVFFHLALLLLALALSLLSSPRPDPSASPPELFSALAKALLRSLIGGYARPGSSLDFLHRMRRTLMTVLFFLICAASGFLSVAAACWEHELPDGWKLMGVGLRGAVFGVIYGGHYVYQRRWVLKFPIIQRPLFFSFKMGLSSSLKQALRLSTSAFFCSIVMMVFLPDQYKSKNTVGKYINQQINFYIGISAVSFCWELSHHLLQVVHTRRCIFAPPQGSAAAETNPSESLLEALEQSPPRSLLQYLAYLDLCTVSESNVEPWRRSAFFEETGETYRRIISVCSRPLEQLTSRLAEGLEGFSVDKSDLLSQQLYSPTDVPVDLRLHEAFHDFQLYAWSARTAAVLTARSHSEDRYGVAQLTGCNASVLSTLLSCLLAVEACLGKKTNLQPPHLMGPTSIRWATVNTARRDTVAVVTSKKRSSMLHANAYAMADVLRTSIYQIVSMFQADMQVNAKSSVLEKNWIAERKPLYGTREILVQKLCLFLEFHAV